MAKITIYTEATDKKAFACALDWPGWARAAKTQDLAIEALAAYADRYAPLASAAGIRWPERLDFKVGRRPAPASTAIDCPSHNNAVPRKGTASPQSGGAGNRTRVLRC